MQDLSEKSNVIFKGLMDRGKITEKQLTCFTIEHKKATNVGEMYLLPKIHKSLYDVPGRPFTSNCGTSTEKSSEFLDNTLKEAMQNVWSYMKDSHDFLKKIKHLKIVPNNALFVNPDIVGLNPSIPHEAGLRALKEVLDRRKDKDLYWRSFLVKMAEFVLKITTLSSTVSSNIEYRVQLFAQTKEIQPLVWFRYIDDIFFIWIPGSR